MGRKRCCGLIDELPVCNTFIAENGRNNQCTVIHLEEAEALRLVDGTGLSQEQAADVMGLSRPTFQRILGNARKKVALALWKGLTIKIEGGHFKMNPRTFQCIACSHTWQEASCLEGGAHGYELACPKCGSKEKQKIGEDGVKHHCGGQQHGHGHQHQHQHQHHGGGCCGRK